MKQFKTNLFVLCVLCVSVVNVHAGIQVLKTGWTIRSSAEVSASGEKISTAGFDARGWYTTNVPSTVLGALVKNEVYRDPYFGRNLESIPYEPFRVSWWYRKEFDLDSSVRVESARLIFDGINYSANVFVNGAKVASVDDVFGAFRRIDLDITRRVRPKKNVLAVQVFPPKPGDFTVGFVDWNPTPPDQNMGLWREVKLHVAGPVTIEHPFVQTKLNLQSFQDARLTVSGTLTNHSKSRISGKINGKMDGGHAFTQNYSLAPNETKEMREEMTIQNPRVWWPNHLGNPELYALRLTVRDSQGISDIRDVTFGIREVADYINKEGHRGYMVNGKKVLIRGGGWVDDLLLNEDEKNLEAQFRYIKHLNLNLIRLEGFWGSSEKLYELADRNGILVMAGFSCQWEWTHYLGKYADEPYGGIRSEEDMKLVTHYLRDQVVWLRNHPSILVWALASDMLPNPELEKRYRSDLAVIDPTRPALSATKGRTSKVSGPSAVKMNGPYEYVTPNYWYVDDEFGGAFGFDTEVSPGAQPPPQESIERMFAKEHWWPIDDHWNFHSGRNEFNTMQRYLTAFNKRYGEAEFYDVFAHKAQAMNYEAIRAMFEAFGIRKPVSTGIVQWMLNAAWPKMFWQLYDYYLMPGGAFYGARKANQPLHIAYDYGNHSIHVVNDTYVDYPNLEANIKIVSVESKTLFSKTIKTSVGQNESKKILELPKIEKSVPVFFLSLQLKDANSGNTSDNFYWLSSKPDVLDFKGSEWFYTPLKEHADFTALNKLPPVNVHVEQQWSDNGVEVTLRNPSPHVAFFIEVKVIGNQSGRSVLPVLWNDNYVSLLPGESRQLTAQFSPEDLRGEKPVLRYSGWNVAEIQPWEQSTQARALDGARASCPQSSSSADWKSALEGGMTSW